MKLLCELYLITICKAKKQNKNRNICISGNPKIIFVCLFVYLFVVVVGVVVVVFFLGGGGWD